MQERKLQQYLLREYPQEDARCEWKEYKNLKNSFCGNEKDDVISYVSAIANMEGGHLVIGVKDKTLEIVGTDFRNECLCRALLDFNMIDTVSLGIKKMFNEQWRRHFPMPDYEIDQVKKKVVVRIYGNEINKRYTDLLKTNDTLSLWNCISLDAVQKGRTIHEDIAQNLLKRGLIEGEAPHYSISLSIAKNTHQLPSYTKTKGLDKERLRQMVLQYLSNAGEEGAKRDSIYEYLKDVLPANKTEEQQLRMLGDLLKNMSKECLIKAEGRTWYTIPQS